VKFLGGDLQDDQRGQERKEQRAAGQVAPAERHGHGVATGLAERGGGNLDDPEAERVVA
jgi:hypothetical protein